MPCSWVWMAHESLNKNFGIVTKKEDGEASEILKKEKQLKAVIQGF